MRQILDVYDLLDRADASGAMMEEYMRSLGAENVDVTTIEGPKGKEREVKMVDSDYWKSNFWENLI